MENIAYIPLSNGEYAKVDQEDYTYLMQWRWKRQPQGYAARTVENYKKNVTLLMHRAIMKPEPGLEVDHINGDKLDNRRSNLRCVSHALNERNKPLNPRNTSGHTGVYWDKSRRKWSVETKHNGKKIYLGRYSTIEEAAQARQRWEKEHIPALPVPPLLVEKLTQPYSEAEREAVA